VITLYTQTKGKRSNKYVGCVSSSTGYVYISTKTKHIAAHRLSYEAFHNVTLTKDQHINHINRIKHDNRISNLEVVTNQQNTQWGVCRTGNMKGACWVKEKQKWKAELKYNFINYFLGYYDTELEAGKAYNDFAAYMNETTDSKYLLNTIDEPGYIPNPINVPEETTRLIKENKSCSDYVGVVYDKRRNNFCAAIKFRLKNTYLGSCKEAVEAAKLYNQQAAYYNTLGGKYILNEIPGYVTVAKDVISGVKEAYKLKKASSYIGVTYSKQRELWHAVLGFDKKQVHLGFYKNEVDAAKAYNVKAKELNQKILKVPTVEQFIINL